MQKESPVLTRSSLHLAHDRVMKVRRDLVAFRVDNEAELRVLRTSKVNQWFGGSFEKSLGREKEKEKETGRDRQRAKRTPSERTS